VPSAFTGTISRQSVRRYVGGGEACRVQLVPQEGRMSPPRHSSGVGLATVALQYAGSWNHRAAESLDMIGGPGGS
jgi:hypothetical protein